MSKHRFGWVILLALGCVVPSPAQPPVRLTQPPALPKAPAKATDLALTTVPTDSFMFASVKVSKLWDNPASMLFRGWHASQKPEPFGTVIGLHPAEVDRVTLFLPSGLNERRNDGPLLLISTRKPYNEAKVLKSLGVGQRGNVPEPQVTGRIVQIEGKFSGVAFLDERTILYLPDERNDATGLANLVAQLIARKPDGPLAAAIATANDHDVVLGLDVRGLDNLFREPDKEFVPFLALLKAKTATLTADFDKTATGKLILAFPDAATAKRAAPVLEEGIKTVIKSLEEQLESRPPPSEARIEKAIFTWAISVLKAAKITTDGANVIATADVTYQEDLAKFVQALPKSIDGARNNTRGLNNLKQLGLAMHSYHDTMGFLPGDLGFGDKPTAWSWRIQLLPYVEQANLYNQLDLTRPWDHPANLKVLESLEMPKVFEIPGRSAPKGYTYFRVFSMPKNSKGTEMPLFKEGERGPRLTSITDGTSNTFMIVEAGEAVPWYKPDLLAYDGKLPLPPLGDKTADRMLVGFCDGSVKSLRPSKLDEKTIRGLITINGGEIIDVPK